jgi:hypothetical protein
MNKIISVLALTVIVLPLSVTLLISGPDNVLDACTRFFHKLFEQATRFGMN